MPGIVGLVSRQPPALCSARVMEMVACMQHEAFYVSGIHAAPELGVFAGWSAHEHSFADCQPIVGDDQVTLVFSGECYSDPDSRRKPTGLQRRSRDNTASRLLELYKEREHTFFEELNGVFSGLLIDRQRRKAVLFNDRYGLDRIYYHEGQEGFYFASEAKSLLRILPELRAYDNEGLADFLRYGCTSDWRSLFRDVRILPAGSAWDIARQPCKKHFYFTQVAPESQPQLSVESFQEEFTNTLTRVIGRYFDSDRPIGVSLTGGIDTRLIMAYSSARNGQLTSYTFGGVAGDTMDVRLAARVASACRIPHRVLRIGSDFFSGYSSLVDRTVYVTDGYFGVCGAHEIYLNRQARGLAPVRLTGNFGSELFRGVSTFKPLGLSPNLIDPGLRRELLDERSLASNGTSPNAVSFAAFKEIPWKLFGSARAGQSQVSMRTPYLDNELLALAFRAPAVCRRSLMPWATILKRVGAGLASIPTDQGLLPVSPFLSSVASIWHKTSFRLDYWRKDALPHWLTGFDDLLSGLDGILGSHRFLTYRRWFRHELAEYACDELRASRTLQSPLWNRRFIDQLADDHIKGRKNYLPDINMVLTCATIDRVLLRAAGTQSSLGNTR
jgi:asparagine synthase (glutamine-hydrolysing)